MKKIITWMLTSAFLLASCAPQAQPTDDLASIGDLLVNRLSENLGMDEGEINIQSVRDAEFSDSCLDVASGNTACVQVVTPGMIFTLEANGIEYKYRTNAEGDLVQPATLALIWMREGGFAGFCDRLTVYLSGEVYGSNCRSDSAETSGYFAQLLTAAQQTKFSSWFTKYGEIRLDGSDPQGVADRMINTLIFYGDGPAKPGTADQQAMFDWVLELYQKLYS